MEYIELLKKARKELPEGVTTADRFQVEKIKGHLEGNKTVLINFKKIAKDLGRDWEHMLKFLLKELASPGKVRGDRILLGAKVSAGRINQKIRQYVNEFVICSLCGKPDTVITKKKEGSFLKCKACGDEHLVKTL